MIHAVSDEMPVLPNPKMVRLVGNAVNEVCLLQKTIESQSSDNKKSIANAIIRQKRALVKLRQWASEGSAIAGVGYVKACCISGLQVDHIFKFRDYYNDVNGSEYVEKLFEPQHLIPFLQKQDVLNKTQSIASFVLEFPDLTMGSFNATLFDALHTPNQQGITFNQQLADKLQEAYQIAESDSLAGGIEQTALRNAIQMTAEKGYAAVQNLGCSLALREGNYALSQKMGQLVLMNKYSSSEDVAVARRALKLERTSRMPFVMPAKEMIA